MRKGETGDWVRHLTEEQLARMRAWEENELQESDLSFVYQL